MYMMDPTCKLSMKCLVRNEIACLKSEIGIIQWSERQDGWSSTKLDAPTSSKIDVAATRLPCHRQCQQVICTQAQWLYCRFHMLHICPCHCHATRSYSTLIAKVLRQTHNPRPSKGPDSWPPAWSCEEHRWQEKAAWVELNSQTDVHREHQWQEVAQELKGRTGGHKEGCLTCWGKRGR